MSRSANPSQRRRFFSLFLTLALGTGFLQANEPNASFETTSKKRAGLDWWSLQPVQSPAPPKVSRPAWVRNPIDAFVLAKLDAAQLQPAPECSPRLLVRRLYLNLIGLPPNPDEVDSFLHDHATDADQALKSLVDNLLDSPHYGERWARHWLDVARYGESDGFEYDNLRPNAWAYRDWVIKALNQDMPYTQFARWQIAGDVLAPNNPEAITATGFLVCGSFDGLKPQGDKMRKIMREDEMEDLVGTVSQSFLGLTVHCARCHDHKFDPIRQKEYYQLSSALSGVHRGDREVTPDVNLNASKEEEAQGKKRKVYAVTPRKASVAHLLVRGSPFEPGEKVAPGGVASLKGLTPDFQLPPDAPDKERRIQLAQWITDGNNPLFARVMMNRLWHYHFGQGLIKTPNDFGFNGGLPSHPELLDWLAHTFRENHWSLKKMHALITTSATYLQSSRMNPDAAEIDANNRLLWRHTPARLDAEVLRDAILSVAGQLNRATGGPGFQDFKMYKHKGSWVYDPLDPEGAQFNRRSIYRTWARGSIHPLLSTFDCPDPSATAPVRSVTTTPLNALSLMNTSFVLRMADHLAQRVQSEAGSAPETQVQRAYHLVLGRTPTDEELRITTRFVQKNGLPAFGRVLFNANEFLYVN